MRSLLTQAITPLDVLISGLPESVSGTIMRMLQRDRVNRPQSLDEVVDVLRVYLPGYSSPRVSHGVKSSGRRPLLTGGRRSDPPLPLALAETASINPARGTTLVSASDRPSRPAPPSRRNVPLKIAIGLGLVVAGYWWLSPTPSEPARPSETPPSAAAPPTVAVVPPPLPATPAVTPVPQPTASIVPSSTAAPSARPKAVAQKAPIPKAANASSANATPPSVPAPRKRPADGLQEEPPF